MEVIHYPLYIENPSHVGLSIEQFYNLSYAGIAALMCSFSFVILDENDHYQIYMTQSGEHYKLFENHRFDLKLFENPAIECFIFDVPKEHRLYSIVSRFKNRILEHETKND